MMGDMRRSLAAVLCGVLVVVSACSAKEPVAAPPPHHTGSAGPDQPLRAGERFSTLTMPASYRPAAPHGGSDEYRCFLVDPGLTRDAFLTGSRFQPGNAALVHHAIFFRIRPEQADQARAVDAADPGEGWTCFGDAGVGDGAAWVAHWAPGVGETALAPEIGYPMPVGSKMVMQVHYNLLGSPGGTDRSSIRLRLTDRPGLQPLDTMTLPAPVELPCAAGESGPLCDRAAAIRDVASRFGEGSAGMVEGLRQRCGADPGPRQHCDHEVDRAGLVYAVGGHMHLLGRAISIDLNGRRLLDVPSYDFDEQAVIPLATPVAVKPGDELRVNCTHDAALRGQLPQLRGLPPRYVVWGDGTADEMCLGLVVWSPAG